jgi:hypothetical protein
MISNTMFLLFLASSKTIFSYVRQYLHYYLRQCQGEFGTGCRSWTRSIRSA